jgi:hypothetical protein
MENPMREKHKESTSSRSGSAVDRWNLIQQPSHYGEMQLYRAEPEFGIPIETIRLLKTVDS